MTQESIQRWSTMLEQARGFARHNPHDAVGRVEQVLAELEVALATDPDSQELAGLSQRARSALVRHQAAVHRVADEAEARHGAYTQRVHREIEG